MLKNESKLYFSKLSKNLYFYKERSLNSPLYESFIIIQSIVIYLSVLGIIKCI